MPRYMVQRTFPEGLQIPVSAGGSAICAQVVDSNAEDEPYRARRGPRRRWGYGTVIGRRGGGGSTRSRPRQSG